MAKASSNLIATPVSQLLGNPANRGSQGKPIISGHPRSKNSGVPEKQFDSAMPKPSKSPNPTKGLLNTPVTDTLK